MGDEFAEDTRLEISFMFYVGLIILPIAWWTGTGKEGIGTTKEA